MNAACECTVLCAIVWVCEAHLGHGIITHLCESDPGSQIHNSLAHTQNMLKLKTWSWCPFAIPVFTIPWVHISALNSCLVPQMRNNNHDSLTHCILHRHTQCQFYRPANMQKLNTYIHDNIHKQFLAPASHTFYGDFP